MTLVRIVLALAVTIPAFSADHNNPQTTSTARRFVLDTKNQKPIKPMGLPKLENQKLAINIMKNFKETGDYYCSEMIKAEFLSDKMSAQQQEILKGELKLGKIICNSLAGFIGFTDIEDANERMIAMKTTIELGLFNLMDILRNVDNAGFMMANSTYSIFRQDVALFYQDALFNTLYPDLKTNPTLSRALIDFEQYASRLIEYYKKA